MCVFLAATIDEGVAGVGGGVVEVAAQGQLARTYTGHPTELCSGSGTACTDLYRTPNRTM